MKRWHTLTLFLLLAAAVGLVVVLADRVERISEVGPTAGEELISLRVAPEAGIYPSGVAITLQPYRARGQVALTVDGTIPTAAVGTPYQGQIRFDRSLPGVRILRAVEIYGDAVGPLLTTSYIVGMVPELPVLSIVADPNDLWDADIGVLANPTWRGSEWERQIHATFFLGGEVHQLPLGIRVHDDLPSDAPKQSLRLYARESYGVDRLAVPLFPAHARQSAQDQSYKRLTLQAGEHGVVWTLLRDQVVSGVAKALGLPVAEGRFMWVFVNGSSWGLYRLTERVDRFMLSDGYGFSGVDVLQEGNPRDGLDDDWDALIDRAGDGDMAEPDTLAWFAARIDLDNFTDFAILYRHFDFPPEALITVRSQGGRWFWVYEGAATQRARRADFDLLLTALLKNPEYRERFERRAANLASTILDPGSVATYVGPLESALAPSFDHERTRWPAVPPWSREVAAFQAAYEARWGATADQSGMSAALSLRVIPPGTGSLYVDGIRVLDGASEWQGKYVPGTALTLTAVPQPGYGFSRWSGASDATSTAITVTLDQPVVLTAEFGQRRQDELGPYPDDVLINEIWINDDGTEYPTLGYRPLEGDWIELLVRSAAPVDLRGWRLTDNDSKTGVAEGSLIFPDDDALAEVPCGTVILIVATESDANSAAFPADDLNAVDRRLILYVGNGTLDVSTDPGFGLGTQDDNLALLAPGPTMAFSDDVGVDFVAEGQQVTPYSFGILADGVVFDVPFDRLGSDDGAVFVGRGGNDHIRDWRVDPTACESLDEACLGTVTVVSPGALNSGQQLYRLGCMARRLRSQAPHE